MRDVPYTQVLGLATEKMSKGGVFLSVGGDTPNTLTIGWGAIGFYWGKPIFTAVLRPQRHTYPILVNRREFTVSVPLDDALKQQLAFAGTQSGAKLNKFEGHGITAAPARIVDAPIVRECGLHFECRVLLMQDMTGDRMHESVRQTAYPAADFHTMFFGEILACYYSE